MDIKRKNEKKREKSSKELLQNPKHELELKGFGLRGGEPSFSVDAFKKIKSRKVR
jgi:hypothetical protein